MAFERQQKRVQLVHWADGENNVAGKRSGTLVTELAAQCCLLILIGYLVVWETNAVEDGVLTNGKSAAFAPPPAHALKVGLAA